MKPSLLILVALVLLAPRTFAPPGGVVASAAESQILASVRHTAPPPHNHLYRFHESGDHDRRIRYIGTILGISFGILCGFLLAFVVLWLIWQRVRHSGEGQGDVELELAPLPAPFPAQGLELATISMLPVVAYPPPPPRPDDVSYSTCPICLEDFSMEAEVRVLPCHHYYHPACIDPILLLRSQCPFCRQTVTIGDI